MKHTTTAQVQRVATSLVANGYAADDANIMRVLGDEPIAVRFARFAELVRAEVEAMEQERRDMAALLGR